ALYFFNQMCGLSPASSFGIMGLVTFLVSILLCLRFSDLFFSFFSRLFLYPFLRFQRPNPEAVENASEAVLIMDSATWRNAFLLAGVLPKTHFLIPADSKKCHWGCSFFYSIHRSSEEKNIEAILKQARELQEREFTPCLMLEKPLP